MRTQGRKQKKAGIVYALLGGGFIKIGCTQQQHARLEALKTCGPYKTTCVCIIKTDDIYGVEGYWHRRFAEKRQNGEWFLLDQSDIDALKKHRFATIDRTGRLVAMDQTALNLLRERDCDSTQQKATNKKMPVAQPSVKRNPIPAGDHILTLVSVSETEQPSFTNTAVMQTRWIWQFKAQQRDEETGERFEFRVYTGTAYGHEKATLTGLLDMMLPDWDDEDKAAINTDDILNTSYSAVVRHDRTGKNGADGKPEFRPVLAVIKPYKKPKKETPAETPAKGKAKPVDDEDDEDNEDASEEPDPFKDE